MLIVEATVIRQQSVINHRIRQIGINRFYRRDFVYLYRTRWHIGYIYAVLQILYHLLFSATERLRNQGKVRRVMQYPYIIEVLPQISLALYNLVNLSLYFLRCFLAEVHREIVNSLYIIQHRIKDTKRKSIQVYLNGQFLKVAV